jgi:hypothetical protein
MLVGAGLILFKMLDGLCQRRTPKSASVLKGFTSNRKRPGEIVKRDLRVLTQVLSKCETQRR